MTNGSRTVDVRVDAGPFAGKAGSVMRSDCLPVE